MPDAYPTRPASSPFELKSASLSLVALHLRTTDLDALSRSLMQRFGDNPQTLDQDPVIIDLAPVAREGVGPIDFHRLIDLLRLYHLVPVAVRNGLPNQMAEARDAGLIDAPDGAPQAPAPAPVEPPLPGPMVIDRPLRSGQQVYARGCDLVVLDVVSYGAEIIADGSIHVYAPLRGKAIAGARGSTGARIFSTCMEPALVSIAGIYRTTETPLPTEVLSRPAQIWLDGERLMMEALKL
jgi:septum site-determining protein MinC